MRRMVFGVGVVDPRSVLTDEGLRVFGTLRKAEFDRGFYLAGGTGLALHLGHRVSIDFDWFSADTDLGQPERQAVVGALRRVNEDLEIVTDQDATLTIRWQGVSVSFFTYHYPLLDPVVIIGGLPVASLADIAAMKLAAIVGRGSRKDFVDLYCLMSQQPLDRWLRAAKRKFVHHQDFYAMALHALTYFVDADVEPMPIMRQEINWDSVKEEITAEATRLGRLHFGVGS